MQHLFLFISLLGIHASLAVDQHLSAVRDGLFAGRSGDIVITSHHSADEFRDGMAVFMDPTGLEYSQPTGGAPSLHARDYADIVSRNMGSQPLNADYTPPRNLQTQSMFRKPQANILVSVDSVGAETVNKLNLPNLRGLTASSKSHGRAVYSLDYDSYPHDSLSVATTLTTGKLPVEHGIIGQSWPGSNGAVVRAFEGGEQSWSLSGNVADVLTQTYEGQPLTLSISSDSQKAAAHCVHPSILLEHAEWNNFCFAFDSQYQYEPNDVQKNAFRPIQSLGGYKGSAAASISSSESSNSRKQIERLLSLYTRDILHAFEGGDNVLSLLGARDDIKATYDNELVYVQHGSSRSKAVAFDLKNSAELSLMAELQYFYVLPDLMVASPLVTPLLRDDAPDSIVLSLSSISKIADIYGRDSIQYSAGLQLVDALIPKLLKKWSDMWVVTESGVSGRVATQLILLGSDSTAYSALSSADKQALVRRVHSVFPEVSDFPFYPFVYLPAGSQSASFNEETFQTKCRELNTALEHISFSVYCSKHPNSLASPVHFSQLAHVSLGSVGADSSNSTVSDNDRQMYQIALWTSLILVACAFLGSYSIAFMSFKKDSLIYGSFNPHWEDRKRGK